MRIYWFGGSYGRFDVRKKQKERNRRKERKRVHDTKVSRFWWKQKAERRHGEEL